MTTTVRNAVTIEVSEDRLRAELLVRQAESDSLSSESIQSLLKDRGIPITPEVLARIKQFTALVGEDRIPLKPFLLAEGRPAVPGTPARVVLASNEQETDPEDEEGRTDFYQSQILTVAEGAVVGTYAAEESARAGVDVFGKSIPGSLTGTSIQLGENVTLADDGRTILAKTAGKVHLARQQLSVLAVVEIKTDVDFSTGNIESPTDVLIQGTVRDAFTVKSDKSVSVRGAIEAATVEAGTDVEVSGGIAARGLGRVSARGQIRTKFCDEATLYADGDIIVTRQSLNSQVYTGGRLMLPRGVLLGGYAYAREGGEIKVLGNNAYRKTEVAVGVDPVALAKAGEIDQIIHKRKEAAAKIREKIQPLMALLKQLNPQQRERATELMYQADEIDAQVDEYENHKRELIASCSPAEIPCLLVTSTVFPGVKVIFGDRAAVFRKERKGPIKIESRLINRVEEICVVDRSSGSVTLLPTYNYVPDEPAPQPATD